MARIRTIKPSFFKHEGLYDAEVETGLPLRLAFAGLWTICDREGRFKWLPRTIKSDVLPHDDVDFSRVLDALATRGFIIRYSFEGDEFGCVPTFGDHQIVNNRETASKLPCYTQGHVITKDLTRGSRVSHACPTILNHALGEQEQEGKGKERSSYELLSSGDDELALVAAENESDHVSASFDAYNDAAEKGGWPKVQVRTKARIAALRARLKEAGGIEGWCLALDKALSSSHCCGKNDRGWTADFDFLTRQSSFAKLMEGNYDDRKPAKDVRTNPRADALRNALHDAGTARPAQEPDWL